MACSQWTHSPVERKRSCDFAVSQSSRFGCGSIVVMQVLNVQPALMHRHAGVTRRCLVTGSNALCNLVRATRTRQRTFGDDIHRTGRGPASSTSVVSAFTASSAGQPAFTTTAPGTETTTFELACPICTDTQFELGGDRYPSAASMPAYEAAFNITVRIWVLKRKHTMQECARPTALRSLRTHLQHGPQL